MKAKKWLESEAAKRYKQNGSYLPKTEKPRVIFFLTYRGAVEQHLLEAAAVVVESQVPGSGVHILDEARFLEATQQQAFGSFGAWDGIGQRSGQRLPVEQFHKVKLEAITKQEQDRILGLHTHTKKTCKR